MINKDKIYSEILRSTAKFTSMKFVVTFLAALLSIITVRLLGPTELGKLSLTTQIAGVAGMFLGVGLTSTLAKFIPEKVRIEEKGDLYSKCLILILLLFLTLAGLFLILSFFFPLLPPEIKEVKIAFIIFIGISALYSVNTGMFKGIGKFNLLPKLDVLQSLVPKIITIALLYFWLRSFKIPFYNVFFLTFLHWE